MLVKNFLMIVNYFPCIHFTHIAVKDTDKKEAAPEKKEVSATKKEQLATDEERILAAIREADEDLCGFRLVCELSSKPYEMLTEEEMEILRFVQ